MKSGEEDMEKIQAGARGAPSMRRYGCSGDENAIETGEGLDFAVTCDAPKIPLSIDVVFVRRKGAGLSIEKPATADLI